MKICTAKKRQQQQRYQSKVCLIQIFVKAVLFCDMCSNVGVKSWTIFESHANISQTAHYFFHSMHAMAQSKFLELNGEMKEKRVSCQI